MGREPGAGLMRVLEGRAEALAGTLNAQDVANTLWAYATMGREPGAGVMRELGGRAEAVAGAFNAQGVATTLWAACVFSIFRTSAEPSRWVHTVAQRLVSLDKPCLIAVHLCQLHQFFVWCSLDGQWRMEALKDLRSLTDACRETFVGRPVAPSATQKQVSETLRHMGLSVEDEVRCPKSGYSIDMIALGMGGESISGGGAWAVEYDGPSHFLTSRAPTGATLLKRRHLQLLGHALVSVPYWEWDECKGSGDRERYLRGKLKARQGIMTHSERERVMPAHGMAPPQMMMMQPGQDGLSAAWQRGIMNNQPPNAGMNNSKFARSEGPSGFPSLDPMIMQQVLSSTKYYSLVLSITLLITKYYSTHWTR